MKSNKVGNFLDSWGMGVFLGLILVCAIVYSALFYDEEKARDEMIKKFDEKLSKCEGFDECLVYIEGTTNRMSSFMNYSISKGWEVAEVEGRSVNYIRLRRIG